MKYSLVSMVSPYKKKKIAGPCIQSLENEHYRFIITVIITEQNLA